MARALRDGGQASLEYVALLALVAAVLAAGASQALAGGPIAGTVVHALRHALCVVGADECALPLRRPCVVSSLSRTQSATIQVVVRVGRRAAILREERSDGTVAVTEIDDLSAGAGAALGLKGGVALGTRTLAVGGELRASLIARLGHGRTFVVADRKAADRLIHRLVHGRPGTMLVDLPVRVVKGLLGMGERGVPRPAQVYFEGGLEGEAAAGFAGLGGVARGELKATLGLSAGGQWDRRTGRRTFYLRLDEGISGRLGSALFGLRGEGAGSLVAALTYDRRGKPVELTLSSSASLQGAPPALLASIRDRLELGAQTAGRRYEIDARLDLTQAANRAAAQALLEALRDGGVGAGDAVGGLLDRLEVDAQIDVRSYRTETSTIGAEGSIALGGKVGGSLAYERTDARLVSALSRPSGGAWQARADCGIAA